MQFRLGEVSVCRDAIEDVDIDLFRCGYLAGLLGAASGHELGVDVESAAVDVEQRLLGGDQVVAQRDLVLGGRSRKIGRFGWTLAGIAAGAAAGYLLGVDVESAAVDVEQ